ncbi:flagellar hook protein FlgE [Acetohalobium arabaticum]|uniref:Flagellar hook protein FlgE n=1 Tax=Acetohalobium arabaticum (strain ATCC 49924 / DSM 5501 / Z-7288) TaxID=574087 RepID=D9QRK1_ACEAZ|nr:flagellar hook protein FlgE [Acetohalobium arabaticum]ADL13142.1 flagellar hook-basal body protein [Acetohalobium arabaticum DSM 5501]
MMRSMYAGVSGLKAHQTKMDVIGNNISNVNTTGYKGSRVTFKEMLNQTMEGASAPQDGRGGTNPQQIGLGVSLGSIDNNMETGNLQSTGKMTDVALQGEGFFIVNDGTKNLYTRAGNLSFDEEGYLTNSSNGNRVQGWTADEDGTIDKTNAANLEDISLDESMDASATTEAKYKDNLNPTLEELNLTEGSDVFEIDNGATDNINVSLSEGENENEWNFTLSADDPDTEFVASSGSNTLSGTIQLNSDGTVSDIVDSSGSSFTDSGGLATPDIEVNQVAGTAGSTYIELPDFSSSTPHVNASTLFDNTNDGGTTADAITNNTRTITTNVYDSQGAEHTVTMDITKVGANDWQIAESSIDVTDADINDDNGDGDLDWLGGSDHTIQFDADGNIDSGTEATLTFDPATGAADGQEVTLDFSSLTQFDGDMTAGFDTADGYPQGSLESFTIDGSGTITGSYDNGYNKALAKIGVATFSNPAGLSKEGDTLFDTSNNSGDPQVGQAGIGGRGMIAPGSLEMSNVDLARQFTEMITAQRGFQSNSKAISTSDQMLQTLVNLKR